MPSNEPDYVHVAVSMENYSRISSFVYCFAKSDEIIKNNNIILFIVILTCRTLYIFFSLTKVIILSHYKYYMLEL
jgi:hypothetical protein